MDTPILFLIFNRPNETKKVFAAIKKIKPKVLYISADGPRKNIKDEESLCLMSREIIEQVDWECNVKKRFRDTNLGCKNAVSDAINWFFSEVEMGIILEDDCLPNESFFYFCDEMLKKYHGNNEIMMVCGHNPVTNHTDLEYDYFFGKFYSIWGWATWRRSWSRYDLEMKDWHSQKKVDLLKNVFPKKTFLIQNIKIDMERTANKKINTWDIQWVYTCVKNNGLSIVPKYNLISNIGAVGTHGMDLKKMFRQTQDFSNSKNYKHPPEIKFDPVQNLRLYMNQKNFISFIKKQLIFILEKLFKQQ